MISFADEGGRTGEPDLIDLLYQGMLGREPDPEGREAHAAALARDPSVLAQMVTDFAGSPEAALRRGRERLHAPLTDRHDTPFGPVNHVISLGSHCYTSALIKALGLKRQSFPFDWLFSSPELVLDCLRDRFERFLDPVHHRTSPIEDRAEPHINLADHGYYADTLGVRYVFNHRDPNVEEHAAYYRRAVDRFLAVLASDDVKLLLMVDSMRGIGRDTFLAISRELVKIGRNVVFEAIEVVPGAAGDVLETGFKKIAANGQHRLTRFTSTSPIDALAFANPFDDAVIRNAVTQYRFDLPGPAPAV